MKIKQVLENIKKIELIYDENKKIDEEELYNDIICAFENYEFKGVTKVIVSKDESNNNIDYQIYIDHVDAPIICIKIQDFNIKTWIQN